VYVNIFQYLLKANCILYFVLFQLGHNKKLYYPIVLYISN